MATPVIIPKLGNTVESCIIVEWKKTTGEPVAEGEAICDVETDKAVMEVVSPASGTLLARFFDEGDDVPVMTNIAAIGFPGEDVNQLRPDGGEPPAASDNLQAPSGKLQPLAGPEGESQAARGKPEEVFEVEPGTFVGVSPRAQNLADRKGVDVAGLMGTGPGGRIIERDVQAALEARTRLSPVAQAMVAEGGFVAPQTGSGPGGRVMARDLIQVSTEGPKPVAAEAELPSTADLAVEAVPLKGVRKVIAERMLASLQTTAQLTLNASADARVLQAYRQRLKASAEELGLQRVSINDLILFVVSRTLPQFPELNAHFNGEVIKRYRNVHLGVAVDTPAGLMVPVIRDAHTLSLKLLSDKAKRLATACMERRIGPDELTGGTFTVTNLGALGVESFTPVLNPPEVAILGVGNINLKPVDVDGQVAFVPHIGLSLTINHQAVDGAPGARFLQALAQGLAEADLLLAV